MRKLEQLENLPTNERMLTTRRKRRKAPVKSGKRKLTPKVHNPSEPEQLIATYLAILGVEYVREKTWPDLVSVLYEDEPLPVDFWLPDYRVCIEVDGVHHRRPVNGDKSYSLDKRKLNDQTRNLFCLQRGFRMLRIRSDRMENYKEIISEFLNIKE